MRIQSVGDPDAPALVLIHGLSSSPRSWQRNLAVLGAGRRLLVVDLFPTHAGPRFSIQAEAASLGAYLTDIPKPVTLVGHSLGGLIALRLAADAPHVVKRLVLVAVPAYRPARSLGSQLRGVAASGARTDLRSVAVVATTVLTGNPVQLAAATHAALRTDVDALAARIGQPSLLVWGAQDAIVPPEVGRQLACALPDARLAIIADAGHQPQWERPDAFHAAVVPFLAED
jgi:pimeloyl-ACP methyl ester carboxylesterase